ncbi:hypothetical protein EON62_00005, partial [archaeon]
VMGSVFATDPEGTAVTYELTTPSSLVTMSASGAFSVATDLDYETQQPETLSVTATDADGLYSTVSVIVRLVDVNERPFFPDDADSRDVSRDAGAGAFVGRPLMASDVDAGQTLTYFIAPNAYFGINALLGQLYITTSLPPVDADYIVNVTVQDNGVPRLSAWLLVNITVSVFEILNHPPVLPPASINVLESATFGAVVANLSASASDPDGDRLLFSISNGAGIPFALDTYTGMLTVATPLDFETTTSYVLWLSVSDDPDVPSVPSMTTLSVWTINVVDVNERCSFDGVTVALDENTAVATVVTGVLRATDPDDNAAERVVYSITAGNNGNVFGLRSIGDATASQLNSTQVVVARAAVNYELQSVYNLDVTATDKGGLSCVARVNVAVNNLNDAPTLVGSFPSFSVAENSATGTLVGPALVATDEDGDAVAWSLLAGNEDAMFALSSDGQLSLASVPNYEARSTYMLMVQASDGRGGLLTGNISVRIVDVPELPVWTGPEAASVNENSAVGTLVFTARATDQDLNDTLRYSFTSGNTRDMFAIHSTTGAVTVKVASEVDFEVRTLVTLEVTVTDSTGLSIRRAIPVSIVNVNEPPVIVTSMLTVRENTVTGAQLAQPIVVTDPDVGDNFTMSIVGGNSRAGLPSPLFTLTDNFLVIAGAVLDFENAARNEYNITIAVTDAGVPAPALTVTRVVRVVVTDANEPPVMANTARIVNENSAIDASVGAPLVASDPDEGQTLMFSIVSGDPLEYFRVDGCSGQLKVNRLGLDYEANMTFTLTIRVTDNGGEYPGPARLYTTATVDITLADVNEGCIAVDTSREVAENSAVGSPIGAVVTAADVDIYAVNATWRQLRYSLLSNPRDLFAVHATSGQLMVARNAFNYEDVAGNALDVLLVATDGPGLSCMTRVRVQITDVNEAPVLQGTDIVRRIDENTPQSPRSAGDTVGLRISAVDEDADQTDALVYSIVGGNNAGHFGIIASGANAGQLVVTSAGAPALDFETQAVYNLTVRATDAGRVRDTDPVLPLSTDAMFMVRLNNRNEAPWCSPQTRFVWENATRDTPVGVPLVASDWEETSFTWTISAGNEDGVFQVDAATGQVRVNDRTLLDFETTPAYTLTLKARDSGAPDGGVQYALSTNCRVDVAVGDVCEAPTMRSGSLSIAENLGAGALVGSVALLAADQDAGDVLRFSIVAQQLTTANESAFVINATSGDIRVATLNGGRAPVLDFEAKSSYALVIMVTDKCGNTANGSVSVQLTNVNEPVAWLPVPRVMVRARESQSVGRALSAFVRDPDAGDSFSFTFGTPSGNNDTTFRIDAASGQVDVANNDTTSFRYPAGGPGPVYYLRVVVTDAGRDGEPTSAVTFVEVEVTDNNYPPTLPDAVFYVDENSGVGSVVGTMSATDRNAGDGQTVTYSLEPAGVNINRAFPFTIVTLSGGGNGGVGVGSIRVVWDGPIDFEAPAKSAMGFNVYRATAKAVDSHPTHMTGSASVTIIVRDVQEAPYVNATGGAGSGRFTLTVPENSAAGTQLRVVEAESSLPASPEGGLFALDDDAQQGHGNLTYTWAPSVPTAVSSLFTLHPKTGVVTVSAAGGAAGTLNFEAQSSYTLSVVVADVTGRTDTASVRVRLLDVNEAPSRFGTGLADGSGAQVTSVSVREDAAVGSILGRALASDVDAGAAGTLRFTLLEDEQSAPFGVFAANGSLWLAAAGLDFENRDAHTLRINVTDAGEPALWTVFNVTVRVLDVNDAVVTSFRVHPDDVATNAGVNIVAGGSGKYDVTHAAMHVLLRTAGGARVLLSGRNLGRTSARLARDGADVSSALVHATYGETGVEYTATNCVVSVAYTEVMCTVAAGYGVNHRWIVEVRSGAAGAVMGSTTSTCTSGYLPPLITAIFRPVTGSQSPADPTTQTVPTTGAASVVVQGDNFGPTTAAMLLTYSNSVGSEYTTAVCTHAPDAVHAQMSCAFSPGIGAQLQFRVKDRDNRLQVSDVFNNTLVRYTEPSISGLSQARLNTRGGGVVIISGNNFGPAGTPRIVGMYSTNFSAAWPVVYTATNCVIDDAAEHVRIACQSVPGVGERMSFKLVIGGQESLPSVPTISYMQPVITDISGLGANMASTEGGQQVVLRGDQFGPLSPTASVTEDGEDIAALLPIARYGHLQPGIMPAALQYAGMSCRVTAANVQIVCFTAPGTGRDHYWAVNLGGQDSAIFMNKSTSYHPPVVALYSGAGASLANTAGGQAVYIDGQNFGPAGTVVENATYGWEGDSFITGCDVIVPHTRLLCWTVVGAGTGLSWLVTIDGQRSVAPTTNYAPPEIHSFEGPGAVNASTDGNQTVVIRGAFLSTQQFLERVTYGPTGTEYDTTRTCRLEVDHTVLSCKTLRGSGRRHRWLVTVGGQTSALSSTFTSYAVPEVTLVTPNTCVTSGCEGSVRVYGKSFNTDLSKLEVRLNAVGLTRPSAEEMQASWASVYAGDVHQASVSRWVSEIASLSVVGRIQPLGNDSFYVDVNITEGFGVNRELFVVVDDVPSNILNFTYRRPVIDNVAPDRVGVRPGFLRVTVDGTSFCNGLHNCGHVEVDGSPVTTLSHSHTKVVFVMEDPSQGAVRSLVVVVDGVASTPVSFQKTVPNFDSLVGQGDWRNMDTAGGESFYIAGVREIGNIPASSIEIMIGGKNCTGVTKEMDGDDCAAQGVDPASALVEQCRTYRLTCTTPPGVGTGKVVLIITPGSMSQVYPTFVFSYGPPVVTGVVHAVDTYVSFTQTDSHGSLVAGIPTVGERVIIRGRNFGVPEENVTSSYASVVFGSYGQGVVVNQTHTQLVVDVPPYQGTGISVTVMLAGQSSTDRATPSSPVPAPVLVRYAVPELLSVSPQGGSTQGGFLLTLTGTNFGTLGGGDPQVPVITVGGRPCIVPATFVPLANHSMLQCVAPAGYGADLPVAVSVSGQVTGASTATFTYAAPRLFAPVTPATGPTAGRTLDGAPINMTVHGMNLGTSGAASLVFRQMNEDEELPDISVPASSIIFQNHTYIEFQMPEGAGELMSIVATVGGQSSTDFVPFSYLPPSIVSFARADKQAYECLPRITQVDGPNGTVFNRSMPADCFRTRGGYPLRIVGESFGGASLIPRVAVFVGSKRCPIESLTHTTITCTMPQGVGDRNPLLVRVGRRSSAFNNDTIFSYDPPMIDMFVPNVPDATGEEVSIRGYNFGFEETVMNIKIGGLACEEAEWMGDIMLRCTPAVDTVGPKNVSVLVANRTEPFVWFDFEEKVTLQCKRGWSGLAGEYCVNCETDMVGAVCPGSELYVDKMYSMPNFWRDNVTTPSPECHPLRQGRAACPLFLACEPQWACLGNNTCAEGYTDWRCSQCLKGKYYRVNGECIKCPNSPWMVFITFMLGGVAACALSWYLNKKAISLALISVGID